jgi:hypothetical protein
MATGVGGKNQTEAPITLFAFPGLLNRKQSSHQAIAISRNDLRISSNLRSDEKVI